MLVNDPTVDEISRLLDKVEPLTKVQKTAYNYLVDYIEDLVELNHEGSRLVNLCRDILLELDKA